ncbi:MAG TPA: ribosomal RNA small subunit methyltransferase A [bacterium]|nr:ribosomal RNA small subunit methyltransferase A [bacterium]
MVGIAPIKRLGQHFLRDEDAARRMVESLAVSPGDHVIEIGPGEGVLTHWLARSPAKSLTLIEIDGRLIPGLLARFGSDGRFRIVHADFLSWEFPESGGKYRVIGNLPYAVTSPILFRLFDHRIRIHDAVVMVQKEVGERLVSGPGCKAYGIPSVLFQLYCRVHLLFYVPREVFRPVPEVDSAVISVHFLDEPVVPIADETFFKTVLKTVFGQRRKMLRNTLKPFVDDPRSLEKLDTDLRRRPEELSPEALVALSEKLIRYAVR